MNNYEKIKSFNMKQMAFMLSIIINAYILEVVKNGPNKVEPEDVLEVLMEEAK